MTILTTIILTILIYEAINFVVFVATDENENVLVILSTGIWYVVAGLVIAIGKKIALARARKTYKYYQFFGKVSESKMENQCDKWLQNYYMTDEVAKQFKQARKGEKITEDYSIRLVREGKEIKTIPMASEILTSNKVKNGTPGMTANFLDNFKIGVDK